MKMGKPVTFVKGQTCRKAGAQSQGPKERYRSMAAGCTKGDCKDRRSSAWGEDVLLLQSACRAFLFD